MDNPLAHPKCTVLLIEDNPDDQALLERALKHADPDIRAVMHNNCNSALNYLLDSEKSNGAMPALILLSISQPQIDGVGFLQRVRADSLSRAIPVVVFSGCTDETAIAACVACGCNSYVRKPVRYTDFTEAIQKILHYWLSLNITA